MQKINHKKVEVLRSFLVVKNRKWQPWEDRPRQFKYFKGWCSDEKGEKMNDNKKVKKEKTDPNIVFSKDKIMLDSLGISSSDLNDSGDMMDELRDIMEGND